MEDAPLPPWLAFPEIPARSIGWRMGPGESARDVFYRWISNLTETELAAYIARYPEPDDWAGEYDLIRKYPWK